MTRRDVLEIAIKVGALLFGVVYVFQFLGTITFFLGAKTPDSSIKHWIPLVVCSMLVGMTSVFLLLLKWGGWMARKLLPGEDPVVLADFAGCQPSILLLTLKCAGVPVLFLTLLSCFVMVIRDLISWGIGPVFLSGSGAWLGSYIGAVLRLALALYLFLGGAFLVRLAFGRKTLPRTTGEAGGIPAAEATTPQIGSYAWERPIFVLALRIIAAVFLTWYSWWLVNVLVFQWVPALRPRSQPEMDWAGLFKGIVTLGFCVYLISGGRRLVEIVFRKKVDEAAAGAA